MWTWNPTKPTTKNFAVTFSTLLLDKKISNSPTCHHHTHPSDLIGQPLPTTTKFTNTTNVRILLYTAQQTKIRILNHDFL